MAQEDVSPYCIQPYAVGKCLAAAVCRVCYAGMCSRGRNRGRNSGTGFSRNDSFGDCCHRSSEGDGGGSTEDSGNADCH